MSNRRKTKEQRLRQIVANNPRKRGKAREELGRISMLNQYATLLDTQQKKEA